MKDLSDIEERLDKALSRIEDAFRAERAANAESDVSALAAENTALRKELEALKAQRDEDVAQLDQLIAQLTPLVDEVM